MSKYFKVGSSIQFVRDVKINEGTNNEFIVKKGERGTARTHGLRGEQDILLDQKDANGRQREVLINTNLLEAVKLEESV